MTAHTRRVEPKATGTNVFQAMLQSCFDVKPPHILLVFLFGMEMFTPYHFTLEIYNLFIILQGLTAMSPPPRLGGEV